MKPRIAATFLLLSACSDDSGGTGAGAPCTTDADCLEEEICFQGVCTLPEELPDLVLDEVDPIRAPARGGDTVTLRGAGFTTDMAVTFGEVDGVVVHVGEAGDEARVKVPDLSDSPGGTHVQVVRDDGQKATFEPFWAYLETLEFEEVWQWQDEGNRGGPLPWDFDADGDDDIVWLSLGDPTSARDLVLAENDEGVIAPPSVVGTCDRASPPCHAALLFADHDLDDDGRPDLVAWRQDLGTTPLFLIKPVDGRIEEAPLPITLDEGPLNFPANGFVVPLDADADGRTDLAFLTAHGSDSAREEAVEVWLQTSSGFSRAGRVETEIATACSGPSGGLCVLGLDRSSDRDEVTVVAQGDEDNLAVIVTVRVVDGELQTQAFPVPEGSATIPSALTGGQLLALWPTHTEPSNESERQYAFSMKEATPTSAIYSNLYFGSLSAGVIEILEGPIPLGSSPFGSPALADWNLDGLDDLVASYGSEDSWSAALYYNERQDRLDLAEVPCCFSNWAREFDLAPHEPPALLFRFDFGHTAAVRRNLGE